MPANVTRVHLEQPVSKTGHGKNVTSEGSYTSRGAGCRDRACGLLGAWRGAVVKSIHPEYLHRHLARGFLLRGRTQRRSRVSQAQGVPPGRGGGRRYPRELGRRIANRGLAKVGEGARQSKGKFGGAGSARCFSGHITSTLRLLRQVESSNPGIRDIYSKNDSKNDEYAV